MSGRRTGSWRYAAVFVAAAGLFIAGCSDDSDDDASADVDAYCEMAAELDAQDTPPTDEQLDAILEATPDEIKDEGETFVAAIKADEDFTEEDIEAEAAIQAFEAENCDSEGGDSDETDTSAAEGGATAASDDTPKEGPVTIANQVDFTFRPVTGTFEVTEGADVLGCSSGSFQDSGSPNEGVARVYTCEAGSNEGSFTSDVSFLAEANTESDSGTWTISEGSDDFVGLQGGGDWSIVYAVGGDPNVAVGTWTGDISFTP